MQCLTLSHTATILAVRCPSGHRASELHKSRRAEADRQFIEQHGPDASISRVDDEWIIDPRGQIAIRPQSDQLTLI